MVRYTIVTADETFFCLYNISDGEEPMVVVDNDCNHGDKFFLEKKIFVSSYVGELAMLTMLGG
jgi:hypothetical protein